MPAPRAKLPLAGVTSTLLYYAHTDGTIIHIRYIVVYTLLVLMMPLILLLPTVNYRSRNSYGHLPVYQKEIKVTASRLNQLPISF